VASEPAFSEGGWHPADQAIINQSDQAKSGKRLWGKCVMIVGGWDEDCVNRSKFVTDPRQAKDRIVDLHFIVKVVLDGGGSR